MFGTVALLADPEKAYLLGLGYRGPSRWPASGCPAAVQLLDFTAAQAGSASSSAAARAPGAAARSLGVAARFSGPTCRVRVDFSLPRRVHGTVSQSVVANHRYHVTGVAHSRCPVSQGAE